MRKLSRTLVNIVLSLAVGCFACGKDEKNDKDDTSTGGNTPSTKVAFSDVNAIVKSSCSGSDCHSRGTSYGTSYVYEDNEDNVKAKKTTMLQRIATNAASPMPPLDSGKTLSDADRTTLTNFLNQ